MPSKHDLLHYADLNEAEMKRICYWQETPLRPEQMQFTKAFAVDTMTFTQWLEFVFLTRVTRGRCGESTSLQQHGQRASRARIRWRSRC